MEQMGGPFGLAPGEGAVCELFHSSPFIFPVSQSFSREVFEETETVWFTSTGARRWPARGDAQRHACAHLFPTKSGCGENLFVLDEMKGARAMSEPPESNRHAFGENTTTAF